MDKNELERRAEQYRQEMMKMYGRSAPSESRQTVQDNTPESEPNIPEAQIDDRDDTAWSEHNEEHDDEISEYNDRYPEPDLSELDTDFGTDNMKDSAEPEYADEHSLGSSTGYIIVNVRAGDESTAIPDATVMITAIVGGKRMIIASGLTNESGTTKKFSVPVPEMILSQSPGSKQRPYNLFDISVTAEGFFNARSVDVPVFSGITSVQNFSMIPIPLMMKANDETMTYYNQEPDFSASEGTEED